MSEALLDTQIVQCQTRSLNQHRLLHPVEPDFLLASWGSLLCLVFAESPTLLVSAAAIIL